ncbi:MAG: hydrolase, partial [Rhodococcus sp. (in: high G+C Gram-positive bacteria)]
MASQLSNRTLRRVLVAGALTAGVVVLPAAPAMAAPLTIPGVGTFEIPDIPGLPPLNLPGVPAPGAPLAPQVTPAAKAVQAAES